MQVLYQWPEWFAIVPRVRGHKIRQPGRAASFSVIPSATFKIIAIVATLRLANSHATDTSVLSVCAAVHISPVESCAVSKSSV